MAASVSTLMRHCGRIPTHVTWARTSVIFIVGPPLPARRPGSQGSRARADAPCPQRVGGHDHDSPPRSRAPPAAGAGGGDELGVVVPASGRRSGRCHECVVEVTAGSDALAPPAAEEAFLRPGYRL